MARSKTKVLFSKRDWITPKGQSNSYIEGTVKKTVEPVFEPKNGVKTKKTYTTIEASLSLASCYKMIDWDFSVYSCNKAGRKKDSRQALAKIVKARKLLNEFFDAAQTALEDIDDQD